MCNFVVWAYLPISPRRHRRLVRRVYASRVYNYAITLCSLGLMNEPCFIHKNPSARLRFLRWGGWRHAVVLLSRVRESHHLSSFSIGHIHTHEHWRSRCSWGPLTSQSHASDNENCDTKRSSASQHLVLLLCVSFSLSPLLFLSFLSRSGDLLCSPLAGLLSTHFNYYYFHFECSRVEIEWREKRKKSRKINKWRKKSESRRRLERGTI